MKGCEGEESNAEQPASTVASWHRLALRPASKHPPNSSVSPPSFLLASFLTLPTVVSTALPLAGRIAAMHGWIDATDSSDGWMDGYPGMVASRDIEDGRTDGTKSTSFTVYMQALLSTAQIWPDLPSCPIDSSHDSTLRRSFSHNLTVLLALNINIGR